jgi:hypothetical protein
MASPSRQEIAAGGSIPADEMETADHPHTDKWFQRNRKEICALVNAIARAIADKKRHILVKAPVKSGKRELVEYISRKMTDCPVKYITALNRVDVKTQKAELEQYGIRTHVTTSGDGLDAALIDVRSSLASGRMVICCYDECDYGAGKNQQMSAIYSEFIDETNVIKIYFSATGQETEASNLNTRADFTVLTFVPPPEYRGAKHFLDAGLVFEPSAFFENDAGTLDITAHGLKVFQESITAARHVGVVRTTRATAIARFKDAHVRKALEKKLEAAKPGKKCKIMPVDAHDSHDWENPELRRGIVLAPDTNYLFVIHQTCTRGTDLKGWHSTLAFWHDQRRCESVNLNTMIQAILRPSHYGEPQAIRMYVDERALMVEAGTLSVAEYLAGGGKAPGRTKALHSRQRQTGVTGTEWAVPTKITLPESVVNDPRMTANISDDTRAWLKPIILSAIHDPAVRATLSERAFKNKRTGAGIETVHRSYIGGQPGKPGGGQKPEIEAKKLELFFADIALENKPGIPKGTAYVTYGVSASSSSESSPASSPGLRTTPASMFESKRGEL